MITENERVKKGAVVLREGNLEEFGKLLNESHKSLSENFEVTGFYLDAIVEEAQKHPGCIGARMTGAGFGGCAIALVENGKLTDFIDTVSSRYKEKIGEEGKFYTVQVVNGVDFLAKL